MTIKKHTSPSEFTRLLNLFHKADWRTMRVIQKTLAAQGDLHNSAVDFNNLFDTLGEAQMAAMDATTRKEAVSGLKLLDRRLKSVLRTIRMMKSTTKAIVAVRFPAEEEDF